MNEVINKGIPGFISYLKLRQTPSGLSNKLVLVEMQSNMSAQIAQSVFLKSSMNSGGKIVAYSPYLTTSLVKISLYRAMLRLGVLRSQVLPFAVYRAMGAGEIVFAKRLRLSFKDKRTFRKTFSFMSKEEILRFDYCGIRVGDLFYDWFLRVGNLPTINPQSKKCQNAFIQFLEGVAYGQEYFQLNRVDEVVVTHSVYEQGIPARFGLKDNSNVYLVTSDRCFKLSEGDYLSDLEFKYYDPEVLEYNGYRIDINRAKVNLESLFQGKLGVDIAHSFVSGLQGINRRRVISTGSRLNVLIAAHCFSASPHANGDHLFPDFYEWLCYLAKLAPQTNYNWYVKAHPAFFESDKRVFRDFCEEFPHIIPVEADFSNVELINQGVNVVLTVYGTIAFEAAYLGALVVDASENTPHMNYSFSLKPKSVSEYREMLLGLDQLRRNELLIDENQILHFYDVHHLRKSDNWLFGSYYEQMVNVMGSVGAQYSDSRIFDFWINLVTTTSHFEELIMKMQDFVSSKRYVL